MHNEVLDRRVIENYNRVSGAAEFGCAVLVAAIQKTIVNGWKYPTFSQSISGEVIDTATIAQPQQAILTK
jgi:hypothetical protein